MPDDTVAKVATYGPLLVMGAGALALGAPLALARVPADVRTPAWVAATASGFLAVAFLGRGALDPYALAIFGATTWAALEALRREHGKPFGAVDLAVWLLLWIPFDLRWNYDIFPGRVDAYNWGSVYLIVVAAIGWGRLRALEGFDYRLAPRPRDLGVALAAIAAVLVTCLPPALATGFCVYPGANEPSLLAAAVAGPAIFVTIALPEEVFFRGVLQGGLERATGRPGLALAAASVAFGLMHWNNTDTAPTTFFQLVYVALATVAGAIYGLAYRKGGSILAPALCHAFADLVWHLFLQR